MSTPEKLERFSAGEKFAVNPDAIERELASLWRAAGASSASRTPVTRACLWNVVVHIEERPGLEGYGWADTLTKVVRDLPHSIAARALVLRTQPDVDDAPELESWISANCIVAEGGGKLVCSEELAIAARREGERHLPALVRALLVPAVPTAVVFAGDPPIERPAVQALIESSDRVITRVDRSKHPNPLKRLAGIAPGLPLGGLDLAWLEHSTLRRLVATLFDSNTCDRDLEALDRVTFSSSPRERWSGRLFVAWMALALRGEAPAAIGDDAWRFQRRDGLPFEARVVTQGQAQLPAIELHSTTRGTTFSVRAIQENLAEVRGPSIDARSVLGKPVEAQFLARALRSRADDRAFMRALQLAGAL